MKRPDRFERMANKIEHLCEVKGCVLRRNEVASLLRKEHAWMRRMVKKIDAWACQELADNDDVVAEIIKQLDQRRK